jgi:hypothetical protein
VDVVLFGDKGLKAIIKEAIREKGILNEGNNQNKNRR